MVDLPERQPYVLGAGCDERTVAKAHDQALRVLRPVLSLVEIDPNSPWPADLDRAVEVLHRIGAEQGRWPPSTRPLARTGVDLDARNDEEFETLVRLSPYALAADAHDPHQPLVYSANDGGDLWLCLTDDEFVELGGRGEESWWRGTA